MILTIVKIANDDGGTLLGEEKSSGTTDTLTIFPKDQRKRMLSVLVQMGVGRSRASKVFNRSLPSTSDNGNLTSEKTGGVSSTAGEMVHDDRDAVGGNRRHCEFEMRSRE
jgi:hypothetical protein